jgi:microcystin-dependent protein
MPIHNHAIAGGGDGAKLSTERAVRKTPIAGDIPAVTTTKSGLAEAEAKSFGPENANSVNAGTVSSGGGSIGNTGGNMGHTNVQPFLTVNYIIALQGIFPSRN